MVDKKKKKVFDLSNYQIETSTKTQTVTIESTGDEFEVTIKPMSWSKRNKLISKCLTFDGAGNSGFDGDLYVKEALKDIIVDSPWGRTTEAFLATIDSRLGVALEQLVPKAFEDDEASVPDIKKD